MNLIQKLVINSNKSIDVVIPPVKDKFNYYFKPTNKLHKFDEIIVVLHKENQEIIIGSDMAKIIVNTPKQVFEYALENGLPLPDNITVGRLGYYYNNYLYKENEEEDFLDFSYGSLWSGKNIQTWMYTSNNKIYLEVAPVYPWIWDEPGTVTDPNYITFDEFMKTYKPIAVEEIDRTTVQKWIEQCDEILDTIADQDNS